MSRKKKYSLNYLLNLILLLKITVSTVCIASTIDFIACSSFTVTFLVVFQYIFHWLHTHHNQKSPLPQCIIIFIGGMQFNCFRNWQHEFYVFKGQWSKGFDVRSFILVILSQVLAFDKDTDKNGEIQYSIRSGKGKTKFRIHNTTGMVYAHKGFEPGQEYELSVRIRVLQRDMLFIGAVKYISFW